ncbi:MAG: hypothetical protein CM1200mP14_15890 [Gammaproteobacteria bacterium]|nr:MAG: hypothetical protein CM1200mP14_15890 [Gammaproteobacteria bacterium]
MIQSERIPRLTLFLSQVPVRSKKLPNSCGSYETTAPGIENKLLRVLYPPARGGTEVVDAILRVLVKGLEGELGDLLLNLGFQIVVAEESDSLDTESVYRHLEEKMVRRHPQLFGNGEEQDWERLKQSERAETRECWQG